MRKMTLKDAAEEVKALVTARQVCDLYGLEVNGANKSLCPWHADSRPSLQIYPGKRGVYCFSCGKYGSVIDLTMAINNLNFRDATLKLIKDFNLDITVDGNAYKTQSKPPEKNYKYLYEKAIRESAEINKDMARLTEVLYQLINGDEIEDLPALVYRYKAPEHYYQKADEIEAEIYKQRKEAG